MSTNSFRLVAVQKHRWCCLWRGLTGGRVFAAALACVVLGSACGGTDDAVLLPARKSAATPPHPGQLVARFVHLSDTHMVDSLSPARFAGAQVVIPSAWRAWESSSTQLLDGIIRMTNRLHASGEHIDFALHTGDACDNAQTNELDWFVRVMDGGELTPLSGPDDRSSDSMPPSELDPYATFTAQGLYRAGVHGDLTSIPWYVAMGNHDTLGIGVFPIVERDGRRATPLPLDMTRPGILLPTLLDPTSSWTHGAVTPAHPGPPPVLDLPAYVEPNPERHYFEKSAFVARMFETLTGPPGHGFIAPDARPWYSTLPVPGLRLITLDTADYVRPIAGLPYQEGCISQPQLDFLQAELDAAEQSNEWVIVASHHPSNSLQLAYGSAIGPEGFRELLNQYSHVIAHLAGHSHLNRVADRGGYIEMETCSTLDAPQEARVVEIWSDAVGSPVIVYRMFDSFDDQLPPLGEDPLRGLRQQAHEMASPSKSNQTTMRAENADPNPEGDAIDREGTWQKRW